MLIKDGSAPDKMSDGHRTYSGNDFSTRHWHFGKKSEKVMEGTCEKCVFGSGYHATECQNSLENIIFEEYSNKKCDCCTKIKYVGEFTDSINNENMNGYSICNTCLVDFRKTAEELKGWYYGKP